jgi:hypothetical protein
MTGPVVEWARRWLGVSQAEARLRLLEEQLRRVQLDLEQMRLNVAAAERVAAQGGDDVVSRVLAVLRRGR